MTPVDTSDEVVERLAHEHEVRSFRDVSDIARSFDQETAATLRAMLAERAALVAERDAERQLRITLERQREASNRYGDECHAALATARRESAEAMREKAAQVCASYSMRNGGWPLVSGGMTAATEKCATAIRALPLPGDEGTEGTST